MTIKRFERKDVLVTSEKVGKFKLNMNILKS